MGFPDNDYLLLRDEPGYHGGEPTEEDDAPGLDAKGWTDLRHSIRGVGYVRASFTVVDGVVSEVTL